MSLLTEAINNTYNVYEGNLRHYFRVLFNSRGANNPYHNIRHSLDVFLKGYDAVHFENMEKTEARAFLIACMLHDYNHSGRAGNDDLNIELAIRAIRKIILPVDEELLPIIECIIKQTEYGPNGHVNKSPDYLGKLIRDADMSQACSQAWIRLVVFGLANEMQLSPEQRLRGQVDFLKSIEFESTWGRWRFAHLIQEKIEEAEELVRILDNE